MHATLAAIEYHLPEKILTTEALAAEHPDWGVEKIDATTGITERHIAEPNECASDLAVAAAKKLFDSGACQPADIDFILLCTQTPDHFLPPTACLIQDRLGVPMTAGAMDFNLGSSGYLYGLGLAEGLISSGQASRVLFLTADTYSRFVNPLDRSVRTLFGDAATATLITAQNEPSIGPFVYGTDGRGGENLIVPAGCMRTPSSTETAVETTDDNGNVRSQNNIYMNGGEIFNFTLAAVPRCIQPLLDKAALKMEDIDLYVFHQANRYMLEHLRKRMKIPAEKFQISIASGNTVSCTVPIALKNAWTDGKIKPGAKVMLVGFGVGYSWGSTIVRWKPDSA